VAATGGLSAAGFFSRLGPQPLRIAHRGYRACAPENTLCAFALSLGRSPMIELDVRLSQDGEVVVFHDASLARTSNAEQLAGALGLASLEVCDWQLAQLRRLDLGSWFLEADPFGMLGLGLVDRAALAATMPQRILSLKEVLAWALAKGMALNIELKALASAQQDRLLVTAVLDQVRTAGAGPQVLLSSFCHDSLRNCRRLAPEIALAALQEGTHPPDLVAYLQALGACAYHPHQALVDAALVRTLRAADLDVNVFTVNDPGQQQQLFDLGVTGIFTDFLEPLPAA